jgi:cytochrome oxidase Cu insertion factor (SCO1/SenC/PrrC family)
VHTRLLVALIAAAAVTGVGIGAAIALLQRGSTPALATAPTLHAQATWPAGAKQAPDFRLRDQSGRIRTLSAERGHVVLLTFLDSHCKQECPIQGRLLADVQRRLGARAGTRADLVVVSVDPWADTGHSERAFAVKSRWRTGWRWLLGAPAQLRQVWRDYGVGVVRTPTDVNHTAVLLLIDPHGFERAAYLVPFLPRDVAADVRALAAS